MAPASKGALLNIHYYYYYYYYFYLYTYDVTYSVDLIPSMECEKKEKRKWKVKMGPQGEMICLSWDILTNETIMKNRLLVWEWITFISWNLLWLMRIVSLQLMFKRLFLKVFQYFVVICITSYTLIDTAGADTVVGRGCCLYCEIARKDGATCTCLFVCLHPHKPFDVSFWYL